MDHRGTGRSTLLDCVSATTDDSLLGGEIDPSEVDECAQDLQHKFGDLSSFSITSAATDIATFITESTNGQNTTVCGVSYGSTLVERLMHLKAPTVTGYVLDGVATTSAAAKDKFPFISMNDRDFGEVADTFLDLCANDEDCSRHFKSTSLPDLLQQLFEKFDKEPNSTCAQLVSVQGAFDPPSLSLRATLGSALLDSTMRAFIPPLVYRLNLCEEGDVTVLKPIFSSTEPQVETEPQGLAYVSVLLYNLINFSEVYEKPAPSFAVLEERSAHATMNGGVGLDKTNRL
uniref:AB hydrolase-1 domain-containing protein n=1 Tax=Peronospora matthiolae TaxID=2874970 RepID=A0AAV1TNN9_9STRA